MMTPARLWQFQARIEPSEGRTSWLYLDSRGNATCGVGHLVASLEAAALLPFHPPISNFDWANLMAAPKNLAAPMYRIDTRGRLSDASIDALFAADVEARLALLRAEFASFDAWPDVAQEGVLDMAYNLGVAGLVEKFPHFVCAVRLGDWVAAAEQCRRTPPVSEERNKATAALFAKAAE